MDEHENFMKAALKEALKAKVADEVPIGAVIVKDGMVIAGAHNRREKTNQAASHAELEAIGKANRKLGSWRLDGCDIYVTAEPCPMCAGAIIQARIKNLYFGVYDNKAGACGSVVNLFKDVKWNHEVKVKAGILKEECEYVLSGFFADLRKRNS